MIELSIMDHGAAFNDAVQAAAQAFEERTQEAVHLRVLPWRGAWTELVKVGLYGDGPHVSEIGTTWLSEFISMNALRPFVGGEIASFGGAKQFLKSAWSSTTPAGQAVGPARLTVMTWAIPWTADIRLLYYRRDLFEKAKIDPATLTTPEALQQACEQLKSAGVAHPLVLPTRRSRMTLHHLAAFVWGAGGDFLSPDLKKPTFQLPTAKAGLYAYFDLVRYLSPEVRQQTETESDAIFAGGHAAMTLSGPWLHAAASVLYEVGPQVAQTLPPGIPYIGGTQLVIWKHTRQAELALALVRYLASPEIQTKLAIESGHLPTRPTVYDREPLIGDPFYQTANLGLARGRSFPAFALWGLLENRLTGAVAAIWEDIQAQAEPDVHAIVDQHIYETANRLAATLTYY